MRKTIAQILGGAAVLAGIYFTWQQVIVSREGQITERFTRATEQLGSNKMEVRIGGIYAFRRIAENSREDFHPVVGILGTFIRGNAPRDRDAEEYTSEIIYPHSATPEPPADIVAALGALVYLSRECDEGIFLDLHGTNLEGAAFGINGNYKPVFLFNTNLQYASLIEVSMPNARFSDSNLRGAIIEHANLNGADFQNAQLNDAVIVNEVDLSGADFESAQLNGALLCEVNLRGANLTQEQLNATADGAEVMLPKDLGLKEPQAWSEAVLCRKN